MPTTTTRTTTMLLLSALLVPAAAGQDSTPDAEDRDWAPLSNAMRDVDPDVREYQEHVIILSSPWMEGRLPGTRGAELAREYVESQFAARGLTPPAPGEEPGTLSYRQRFPLGSSSQMLNRQLSVGDMKFKQGADYEMTRLC